MGGYQVSTRYGFVRSRQLERTFPGEKETGSWPITALRVDYGWGSPPESAWPYGNDWPPVEPPGIDAIAKKYRHSWPYRRIRTIHECKEVANQGVMVSLDITDSWADPWRGVIPPLSGNEIRLPTMHHIVLVNYNSNRDGFKFQNSWGKRWGDHGFGYISAQRLAATWSEAWLVRPMSAEHESPNPGIPGLRTRTFKLSTGSSLHWRELVGDQDERLGWASAIQNSATFEIEELFVRPQYQRSGYGKQLFQSMQVKANELGLTPMMWISFADTAPANLESIRRVAAAAGLSIQPSGVRWAPLAAAPLAWVHDSEVPAEFRYPEKPPAIPSQIIQLARDIAVGLGTGVAANFLYAAFNSWINPNNGKRITAKLGDMELTTSEVSVDEFRKLFKAVHKAKTEDEIRRKMLETGINITVIKLGSDDDRKNSNGL